MDIYNLSFGLLLSIISFWLFVREMTKDKKPIDMSKIQIIGSLFGLFLLGIYLIFSEVVKLQWHKFAIKREPKDAEIVCMKKRKQKRIRKETVKKLCENITQKNQPITAVSRNCEFCCKFTFTFRKKFYLSRKNSVTKFATSPSGGTLADIAGEKQK